MDKRLHLLETFPMQGDDGNRYTVCGYEHLGRVDGTLDPDASWQPIGLAEYRLLSGEHVAVDRTGAMTVARTGVKLSDPQRSAEGRKAKAVQRSKPAAPRARTH